MALHAAGFDSSAIGRAAYEDEARTLDLWYAGGDRYRYFDVPMEIYRALCSSPSAGEYVNREIKPRFRFELEPGRRRFRPDPDRA
jgi:hypothetical protein